MKKAIVGLLLGILLFPMGARAAELSVEQKLAILSQIQTLMVELQNLKAQLEEIRTDDEPEEEWVSSDPIAADLAVEIISDIEGTMSQGCYNRFVLNIPAQEAGPCNVELLPSAELAPKFAELRVRQPAFTMAGPTNGMGASERYGWIDDFEDWLVDYSIYEDEGGLNLL